jgi:3-hydroxyisobutyrate dehydrogenase-like beta-hydroxyacid dehydrogenase
MAAGLDDAGTIAALAEACETIVSICPPDSAVAVADEIAACGFDGVYVDANAIAPATSRSIAELFDRYVDGGVIGPPVSEARRTRLYLSGSDAPGVASLWDQSDLDVRIIDTSSPGAASALKMSYAAWTKGTSGLLLAIRALAESEGVTTALLDEWATSQPDLIERSDRSAKGAAPKAWRWAGEMREIAASFAEVGLPSGFHEGAADTFERLGPFKDRATAVSVDEVIAELLRIRD